MKRIWCALVAGALGSFMAATTALAHDVDRDGIDDVTGEIVQRPAGGEPSGKWPALSIDLGALGIQGVNSATWESDGVTPGAGGATGYLWVGDSWNNIVYKIDVTVPEIVSILSLPVSVDGLGWSGEHLVVHSTNRKVHQVNPITGFVEGTVDSLCATPRGICWKPAGTPFSGQYMWQVDSFVIWTQQVQYFTSNSAFLFPAPPTPIGALTDGWRVWISDTATAGYRQYDISNGTLLKTLDVSLVNGNPRDGTWDGHHLWDVTWENGSWAWQWDLYLELGLYPVTVCANPKHQKVQPGAWGTVWIGLKNHTGDNRPIVGTIEIYDCGGALVFTEGPTSVTLNPGQVIDHEWKKVCPPTALPGIYKVRVEISHPSGLDPHEDWCLVEVGL